MSTATDIIRSIEALASHPDRPGSWQPKDTFGGVTPELIIAPESEEQLCEIVRRSATGSVILAPAGSRHQLLDVRRSDDTRPVVAVCMENLDEVLDYSAEDLTLTAGCGRTLGELDELTSRDDQHLPLDPPFATSATLGGAIACNASGPRSRLHGPIGHVVLGATMVLADGTKVKSGAATVKNVAGYDLHKLFIGSFGSLGIVTRVALRLKAIPEAFCMAEAEAADMAQAETMIGELIRGRTRPCLIELFNSRAARDFNRTLPDEKMLIYVGYEGTSKAVDWQLDHLRSSWRDRVRTFDAPTTAQHYEVMIECPARKAAFSFEAIVSGEARPPFIECCTNDGIAVQASGANGAVFGRGDYELTPEKARDLRQAAGDGGSVKFIQLPPDSEISRWGDVDPPRRWMRAIKEKFDPNRVFPWPGFLGK